MARCVRLKTEGESCSDDSECGMFLKCQQGTCSTVRVSTANEGESCQIDLEEGNPRLCAHGLACAVDLMSGGGTCQPQSDEGASCSFALPNPCKPGLYCASSQGAPPSVMGTCQPLPGQGAACGQGFPADCAFGLVCDQQSQSCISIYSKPEGQPCSTDTECASAHCKDGQCSTSLCGLQDIYAVEL